MDVKTAIETRRSVKQFDPKHRIPEAEVEALISLTQLSPTAFNIQHWRFVVVRDQAGPRSHTRGLMDAAPDYRGLPADRDLCRHQGVGETARALLAQYLSRGSGKGGRNCRQILSRTRAGTTRRGHALGRDRGTDADARGEGHGIRLLPHGPVGLRRGGKGHQAPPTTTRSSCSSPSARVFRNPGRVGVSYRCRRSCSSIISETTRNILPAHRTGTYPRQNDPIGR